MSSDNLLKGFGIGADVAGQLATAVALRRKGSTKSSDAISNTIEGINGTVVNIQETLDAVQGEFINAAVTAIPNNVVPHSLGRVPAGGLIVQAALPGQFVVTLVTDEEATVASTVATDIVLWVL